MKAIGFGILLAGTALVTGCGEGDGNSTVAGTTEAPGGGGDVQLIPDTTIGATYGATGPRKCSTKKVPANGPPSPDVIAKYVICGAEGVMSSNVYLLDQVVVSAVAPGRPYNPNEDVNMSNIDINKPVYAIKGSLVGYQCAEVQKPGQDFGKQYDKGSNCNRTPQPNAHGLCFQDTFGDWSCSLVDVDAPINPEREKPAP
ncbi:hypothetical protein [uncultured Sphingomonas sp.]|uniref:hypothetical protein n=1 Tax=uncultured Sphingomonas sp. TaxID=158754 RepID=UPI0035C95ECA